MLSLASPILAISLPSCWLLKISKQRYGPKHPTGTFYACTILVRGLFSKLQFPYVQFPCASLTGDQMFEPFWEAVGRLELCGFKVLALTCDDGLAANRRLFKLHKPGSKS